MPNIFTFKRLSNSYTVVLIMYMAQQWCVKLITLKQTV